MGYDVWYNGAITIAPPLSEADAALVLAVTRGERTAHTEAIFAAIEASDAPELPHYMGLFEVADDRASLLLDDGDSREGVPEWLALLIRFVFAPRGYVLSGQGSWCGEDDDDSGWFFVKDNQLEVIPDVILNYGPSWEPYYHVDPRLKVLLEELVASAEQTGCSDDLTVVSASVVERLRLILAQL